MIDPVDAKKGHHVRINKRPPWGHKVHVSIYLEKYATEAEIAAITDAVNAAAPDATFVGVEIHTVRHEPQDQAGL